MSGDASKTLLAGIATAVETLQSLAQFEPQIRAAADMISSCLTSGNQLLACGNGGSAADAADFCTEFACRFTEDRRPYPAINLSAGPSLLTATANDYGFDEVFARQVCAFGRPNDTLIAISTSGKSKNICRALQQGRDQKLRTIALLGRNGGAAAGLADVEIIVKGDSTARIQEGHKFILHILCEICEARLPRQ